MSWDAKVAGMASIVPGPAGKPQRVASGVVPQSLLAGMHRDQVEPGGKG